jgi:hypothetical protein
MHELRRQLGRWEAAARLDEEANRFSSGCAAIDRLLPGGSLRHGMLVEWLGGEWGGGAEEQWSRAEVGQRSRVEQPKKNYSTTPLLHYSSACTLSLLVAREACREGGRLVVLDRQQTFYPPAAAAWGIDLDRLIVVRPQSARDELWAAVESLRSAAVAAVWGAIDRLDNRAFRRLQLAAQAGRTLGLLLRPPSARGQPSWADVRLAVESRVESRESRARIPVLVSRLRALDSLRHVHVRVLRTRGGRPGGSAILDIDDATHSVREASTNHVPHPLPVAAELADPAAPSRSARA